MEEAFTLLKFWSTVNTWGTLPSLKVTVSCQACLFELIERKTFTGSSEYLNKTVRDFIFRLQRNRPRSRGLWETSRSRSFRQLEEMARFCGLQHFRSPMCPQAIPRARGPWQRPHYVAKAEATGLNAREVTPRRSTSLGHKTAKQRQRM